MAKPSVQTGMSRTLTFPVSIGRGAERVDLGTFTARVTFANLDQAVDAGARSVVIRMQGMVRKAHEESKPCPYPTDKVFVTNHLGHYTAPVEEQAKRVLAAMPPELRAAFAKLMAQELAVSSPAISEPQDTADDDEDETSSPNMVYDEDQLNKLPRAKLVALATKEHFEGVEDMSSSDIIDELTALSR